jgi:hypothetical protein
MVALASSAVPDRRPSPVDATFGALPDRLPLVVRPFPAFAGIALFGFFMGILLNEGLRGFTKTG